MKMEESKAKAWGIALGVLVAALALVDTVALRGDYVDSDTVSLGSTSPGVLEITQAGQEHLVEISTRRRSHGTTKGRALAIRLEGPDGRVIYQTREIRSRKKRYFEFTPDRPGDYAIFVEAGGLLGSNRGHADVKVYVNDRRLLSRLLAF